CLAWKAMSKSTKVFWEGRMGGRQPSRAVSRAGHFTSDSCWVIYLQELQETVADHVAEQVSICLQNHILCFLSMGCCHADIGECLQVLLSDLVTEIYRLWDLIYLCLLECLVSLFSYLKNSQEIPGHTRWSKRRD
uniref:Uncharacterized protein n=1 Tax=Monopterus albus TaxID=43700 RepID=A0A3Q3JYF2_MONAL